MESSAGPRGGWGLRVKRIALVSAMAILTLNVWTGSPLLGLWVGSQVQGSGPPKMEAVFVAFLVLAVAAFTLAKLIGILSHKHDELIGRPPGPREPLPWLRSMRAERSSERERARVMTTTDKILVVSVFSAVVAFEIWFFFFARYTFGN